MEAAPMKLVGIVSTAVLSLTLGAAAPAHGQQEQHDQQEEQKDKPAKGATKATPDKPAKQDEKTARPPDQEDKAARQPDKNAKQEEKTAQQPYRNAKSDEKAAQQQQPQHTEQAKPGQQTQRGGGNGGGRIPDDRYQANFGREHAFRVNQGDYRDRRFQYGGYSFEFVDSWPANWLYTQDVFVVYIDGVYYLCNPMYPGVNIALSLRL
jgi:outer membrane biosynthesis protein TonB